MQYIFTIFCLVIVFFPISCVNRDTESKETLKNQAHVAQVQDSKPRVLETSHRKSQKYVPGQILVKFKQGTDQKAIEGIQKELALKTIRVVSKPYLYLMKITDGTLVEKMIIRLQDFDQVLYSEPNYIVSIN